MRLLFLVALTMSAFAANSVLNRLAVEGGHIDPSTFAVIRVLAGAAVLCMILTARGGRLPLWHKDRIVGGGQPGGLYDRVFTGVCHAGCGVGRADPVRGRANEHVHLFGPARSAADNCARSRARGLHFFGLAVVLWPTQAGFADPVGAALMVCAGIGWAAYTLVGRGAPDPLGATAANFHAGLAFVGCSAGRPRGVYQCNRAWAGRGGGGADLGPWLCVVVRAVATAERVHRRGCSTQRPDYRDFGWSCRVGRTDHAGDCAGRRMCCGGASHCRLRLDLFERVVAERGRRQRPQRPSCRACG